MTQIYRILVQYGIQAQLINVRAETEPQALALAGEIQGATKTRVVDIQPTDAPLTVTFDCTVPPQRVLNAAGRYVELAK